MVGTSVVENHWTADLQAADHPPQVAVLYQTILTASATLKILEGDLSKFCHVHFLSRIELTEKVTPITYGNLKGIESIVLERDYDRKSRNDFRLKVSRPKIALVDFELSRRESDSSIGDLVTDSLTHSLTFDQSDGGT